MREIAGGRRTTRGAADLGVADDKGVLGGLAVGAAAGVLGERLRWRGRGGGRARRTSPAERAGGGRGGGRAQLRQRGVQGGWVWVKGGNNGVVRRNHGRGGGENRQRR